MVGPARSHLTTIETMETHLQLFSTTGFTYDGYRHVQGRQINMADCEVLQAYLSQWCLRGKSFLSYAGQPRGSSARLSDNLHCFLPSSVHVCFGHDFHISLPSTSSSLGQNGITPHLTWVSTQHPGGL
jgi:hypothetical protein